MWKWNNSWIMGGGGFCCLGFYVALEELSFPWRRQHYESRAAKFYIYSALMVYGSEGSLVRHTYCDTGRPFIMVIPEAPWHSPFGSRVLNAYFNELGLSRPEIEPQSLANVRKNIDFSKTYCIFVFGSLFSNTREINTCTYNCVLH